MRKLGLHEVVLGGWSNGGFDVMSYVHQFGGSNLKGLVMIDAAPTGAGADNKTEWVWFREYDSDGCRAYFTRGALLDREKTKQTNSPGSWWTRLRRPVSTVGTPMGQTSDGTAALLDESSAYQNYAEDLGKLEGHAKLLYFVHEEWGGVVGNRAKATPSATVVAHGKHLSFREHPEHFDTALDEMLKGLSP